MTTGVWLNNCLLTMFPLLFIGVFAAGVQAQQGGGLLGFLNFGGSGTSHGRRAPTIEDYTNQGLGLLNYFTSLRRSPIISRTPRRKEDVNLLGIAALGKGVPDRPGLPNIPFLEGVPVVPGVVGSFPGAGECLPQGTPLISPISPSFFQNILRNIPGAQDFLRSLVVVPDLNPEALMGKWYWVLVTPSVHTRHCATSEYKELIRSGDYGRDATFTIFNSFREGFPNGAPKIGFGYGLKQKQHVSIYTQSDPCPYQVVSVGPVSSTGQYEYVFLSNWAKYPVIGLVRNVRMYELRFRREMEETLKRDGYLNLFSNAMGSVQFVDWKRCRNKQVTTGNIVGNFLNGLLFG